MEELTVFQKDLMAKTRRYLQSHWFSFASVETLMELGAGAAPGRSDMNRVIAELMRSTSDHVYAYRDDGSGLVFVGYCRPPSFVKCMSPDDVMKSRRSRDLLPPLEKE